jgi:cobyric acid synthase
VVFDPGRMMRSASAGTGSPGGTKVTATPGSCRSGSRYLRRGRRVLGLCGGYQMLGRAIADPQGIEGAPSHLPGLGLLDVETVMTGEKRLVAATGTTLADGAPFSGYEMHIGDTTG